MRSSTVLVVDDDADFRQLVRLALERAGYKVCEACDGLRALTVIEHAQPDLVLVDITMPVMSGVQLVEELRRRGSLPPFGVIAMSGRIEAHASPTRWFLEKPIPLDLLLGV